MKKLHLFPLIILVLYIFSLLLFPVTAEEYGGGGVYGTKSPEDILNQMKKEKEETSDTENPVEDTTGSKENIVTQEEPEAKPKPLFDEIPNPHLGISCENCHKQKPIPSSTEKEIYTFSNTFEFDEISLCESCHKKVNLHPTGVNPKKLEKPMTIPDIFPTGKYGKSAGTVVCSTCHDLHVSVGNFQMLRGFQKTAFDFEPVFENRETFCKSCHGEKIISQNPHKGDHSPCGFCHASDPKISSNPKQTLRQDAENICYFCHNKINSKHYSDANPYPELKKEPVCETCHDVHGYSKKGYFVTSEYESLATESLKTNPHLKNAFCLTCHTEEPVKGIPNIRFGGNTIETCMRCHRDEFPWRSADFHPINVSADAPGKHKPKNLSLFDGKITCLTCHYADCRVENKKEVKKTNKIFLRGGPYQYRSDICFECHERDAYVKYNVHDQIDSRGIIREGVCLYCHRNQPDRKVRAQKQDFKNLIAPMTDLCVRCHRDKVHPGQKDHIKHASVDMQKRKSVYEIEQNVFLPVDEKENVTCATCHNPHEKGIIPWGAGTKGADEPAKLRLVKKDGLLCQVCHTGQGLK
ncbi:MAG: cytochrome c3 family protein [bacterium]|nr:cytochrome c3 family protein [bacterium]